MAASVGAATLLSVGERGFVLSCASGARVEVTAVDQQTTRTLVLRRAGEPLPPTWTVLPDPDAAADGPAPLSREGCASLPAWPAGSPLPAVEQLPGGAVVLRTGVITLTATLEPSLSLAWAHDASGRTYAQDRLSRAYALGPAPGGPLLHAQRRAPGEQYYGMCDKTGPLDLAGRRLRCESTDALGFDPARGDPLYKHWPLLLVRTAAAQGFGGVSPEAAPACEPEAERLVYGVLYDSGHASFFDLGCENSNYHGPYRSYEAAGGVLDFYVCAAGALLILIDPGAFGDPIAYRQNVTRVSRAARRVRPAPGTEAVLIPGDPESLSAKRRKANGISLPRTTWESLAEIASANGVAMPPATKSVG